MSTQPTPQPDPIVQMVQDPDFGKMAVSEQRKALAAHDPIFQQADDNAIGQFVQVHQATAQPQQPQQPQQEGFWHSLGSVFGLTPERFQQSQQQAAGMSPFQEALTAMTPPNPVSLAKSAAKSVGNEFSKGSQEGQMALDAARQGDIKGALAHSLGQAGHAGATLLAPVMGENLSKAGEQFGQGNVEGGIGTTAGLTLPFLAGAPKAIAKRGLLLGKTPEAAYESALKPSTTLGIDERAQLAQTGLKEGIPVSQKGLEKLSGLIDDVNNQISQKIQSDPNRPISTGTAIQNASNLKSSGPFANQVNPRADLSAIDQSTQEFKDIYGDQMPAAQAQAVKQGTYQALSKKYGELGSAATENQKALARGLKEELANQFPELNDLNARDSRLINLQDSLERAVGRIGNHQLLGIETPIAAGAVKAVSGSGKLGMVAGVMKAVLDNPAVKSRLAIAMAGKGTPGFLQMGKIAAYSGALQKAQPPALPFLPGSSEYPAQSPDQSAK